MQRAAATQNVLDNYAGSIMDRVLPFLIRVVLTIVSTAAFVLLAILGWGAFLLASRISSAYGSISVRFWWRAISAGIAAIDGYSPPLV